MANTFVREHAYFEAYHDQIVKGHLGEYVVIKGLKVMGYYKDMTEGGRDMVRRGYKPGTFATYPCTEKIPVMEVWSPWFIDLSDYSEEITIKSSPPEDVLCEITVP
jgi:hypothetical protein